VLRSQCELLHTTRFVFVARRPHWHSRVVRTDVPLPDTVTEEELRLHAAEVELRQMRDRIRHLEQALRAAGRVLQPYLAGTGR
jgi:hypothetical protein